MPTSMKPSALYRRLAKYGLERDLFDAHVGQVLVSQDGVIHHRFTYGSEHDGLSLTLRKMPMGEVLAGPVCDTCAERLVNEAGLHWGRLLAAHDTAAEATRLAEKGSTVPGRTTKLLTALGGHLRTLRASTVPLELQPMYTRAEETLEEAIRVLSASRNSSIARREVLERVRAEYLPHHLHTMALPESDHLIGLFPAVRGTNNISEIVAALAVPNAQHQVLRAPRYVADYILREAHRSGRAKVVTLTAPVGDLEDEVIQVAARLWDPMSAELADMGVALATAAGVLDGSGHITPPSAA